MNGVPIPEGDVVITADIVRLPPATRCQVSGYHAPTPSRYVHHHIWPLGFDGPNVPENRVEACDNCHYGIHEVLDLLRAGLPVKGYPRGVVKWAAEGWRRIQAQSL